MLPCNWPPPTTTLNMLLEVVIYLKRTSPYTKHSYTFHSQDELSSAQPANAPLSQEINLPVEQVGTDIKMLRHNQGLHPL